MKDYEFELPWPPSINGYWRNFRGRQIISKRGREYRVKVAEVMKGLNLDDEMIDGRMVIAIALYPPTLRKYDIDNFCKAIFDGLTHCGFWVDDEQIDSMLVVKMIKTPPGMVTIGVTVKK